MDQLYFLVSNLLQKSKIRTDLEELNFQLVSHPSYPSLYAISATLDQFNIENIAANVPTDLETYEQLPDTFLAEIKNATENELVVVTKSGEEVSLLASNTNRRQSITDFLSAFTGVILAVEADESGAAANQSRINKTFVKILWGVFGVLLVSLFAIPTLNLYPLIYLVFAVAGASMSVVILQQEQGISTAIGDAFCSGQTEKQSCDAVISSKGSTIFNSLKLSSMSMVYFLTIVLSSIFIQIRGEAFSLLYLISGLALPMTIYSLYYQQFVVKKWCKLCLGIVLILWAGAGLSIYQITSVDSLFNFFNSTQLLSVGFAFIIAILSWNLINPLINSMQELKQTKMGYLKFAKNYELFKYTLQKSVPLNTQTKENNGILLGNRNSPLTLTIITNPLCGHCKKVHGLLEKLRVKYAEEINLQVFFNVSVSNEDSLAVKISEKLLDLYYAEGEEKCLEAMHEVYGDVSPVKWLEKWGEGKGKYLDVLKQEFTWCQQNNIYFTPELLVNGRSFPNEFEKDHMTHFVEDLIEDLQNSETLVQE